MRCIPPARRLERRGWAPTRSLTEWKWNTSALGVPVGSVAALRAVFLCARALAAFKFHLLSAGTWRWGPGKGQHLSHLQLSPTPTRPCRCTTEPKSGILRPAADMDPLVIGQMNSRDGQMGRSQSSLHKEHLSQARTRPFSRDLARPTLEAARNHNGGEMTLE